MDVCDRLNNMCFGKIISGEIFLGEPTADDEDSMRRLLPLIREGGGPLQGSTNGIRFRYNVEDGSGDVQILLCGQVLVRMAVVIDGDHLAALIALGERYKTEQQSLERSIDMPNRFPMFLDSERGTLRVTAPATIVGHYRRFFGEVHELQLQLNDLTYQIAWLVERDLRGRRVGATNLGEPGGINI